MKFDFKTDNFIEEMSGAYFPDSFKKKDVTRDNLKFILMLLWNTKEIYLFGLRYDESQIRNTLMNEMMPEHLDYALEFFKHCPLLTTEQQLAELLFATVKLSDTAIGITLDYSFKQSGDIA